ncbi:MAG: HlyD family efflux transporter periplasmic adaptor subunit [Burkholderiales bacterium]|nr:HlyD family efflux transporter periplasmic adaptor subunit [Burkholderiales bacterium]
MRLAPTIAVMGGILLLTACSADKESTLHGYAEGEFVRVAAPFAGQLTLLSVLRGTHVNSGEALFALEQENEKAARLEAEAHLKSSESQFTNLQKGKRPSEVAAVQAQLEQAQAALKLSRQQLRRDQDLVAKNFISQQRLDEVRAAVARDEARVGELTAQLKTARLGARTDEIAAARSAMTAAQAAVAQAQWRLDQKSIKSPVTGLVHDTLYTAGEWVPAGSPVVSLLPPANIKLRFFIPEPLLAKFKVGQRVQVTCDGCAKFSASVSYVSSQAEYTPPVIYSNEARAKLVYLAEARLTPEDAAKFHPGQPIDISLP